MHHDLLWGSGTKLIGLTSDFMNACLPYGFSVHGLSAEPREQDPHCSLQASEDQVLLSL